MDNFKIRHEHKVIDNYPTTITIATYTENGVPMSSRFTDLAMNEQEVKALIINLRRKDRGRQFLC